MELTHGRDGDRVRVQVWLPASKWNGRFPGMAPETLAAKTTNPVGNTVTRNLCRYPVVSTYNGQGDPNNAASYRCTPPHF